MKEEKGSRCANDNIVPHNILWCWQDVAAGRYNALHTLGQIYEEGLGVKADKQKAIDLYSRFYEEHRGRRVRVDEVELLMKLGHLHMEIGNKYRAAEWYLKAGLQIVNDYPEKDRAKAFKRYKIEKFLRKTGHQDMV